MNCPLVVNPIAGGTVETRWYDMRVSERIYFIEESLGNVEALIEAKNTGNCDGLKVAN